MYNRNLFYNDSEYYHLAHYGVLGMKWGRRKQPQYIPADKRYLELGKKSNKRIRIASTISGGITGALIGGASGGPLGAFGGGAAGAAGGLAGGAINSGVRTFARNVGTNTHYDKKTGKYKNNLSKSKDKLRNAHRGFAEAASYTPYGFGGLVGGPLAYGNTTDYHEEKKTKTKNGKIYK